MPESSAMQIIKTLSDYFKPRKEVAAVYLFGSHAQGTAGASSDIDLGMLFEDHHRATAMEDRDQYLYFSVTRNCFDCSYFWINP